METPAYMNVKTPKVVHTAQSQYNGTIEVVEVGSTVKLNAEGVTQSLSWQSPSARRLVWGQVCDVLRAKEPAFKDILILGLGGGTAQHFISQDFPNASMVSVDIDPTMYEIAKSHFAVDSIPNHRVIIDDACRVIIDPQNYNLEPESFDVAFIDIFIGHKFPELGKSGNFMAAVKSMVKPNGLIIINRIYTKSHQEDVNYFIEFVEDFLRDVETKVIAGYTNSDNVLIYGRN